MTKEQMIKALQDIDRAEELLMRSLDDWEEDYISNKGYINFIYSKLKMDQSDLYTLYAIRRAVSDYCTRAMNSNSPKLRLGANFMEEDTDEPVESDEETSGCILNVVERESQKRAIDTLQTIVNCLQQCYDEGQGTHINKFIPQEAKVYGAVFDDSQFKDMVNIENAVDDCKVKNLEENAADTLFPESFKPWLKYFTIKEAIQVIDSCTENEPNANNDKIMEKAMERIKDIVVSKLAQAVMLSNGGIIEDKEVFDAVVKYIEKYYNCSFRVIGDEIQVSYSE